ncbi:hypothetical protein HDU76_012137 [Blyttiomyces sp. JEL0837]|nr:hypothetical protein HDU76_012137 [Blyttiomyces sp. JEL0837]
MSQSTALKLDQVDEATKPSVGGVDGLTLRSHKKEQETQSSTTTSVLGFSFQAYCLIAVAIIVIYILYTRRKHPRNRRRTRPPPKPFENHHNPLLTRIKMLIDTLPPFISTLIFSPTTPTQQPTLKSTSTTPTSTTTYETAHQKGLTSQHFDLNQNLASDTRKGFVSSEIDEITSIMNQYGCDFDEARLILVRNTMIRNGIDPDTGVMMGGDERVVTFGKKR